MASIIAGAFGGVRIATEEMIRLTDMRSSLLMPSQTWMAQGVMRGGDGFSSSRACSQSLSGWHRNGGLSTGQKRLHF